MPVEAEAGIEPEDPPRQTGSCLVVVETGEQFSSCIRQACVDEIAVRAELLTDEDKRPSDSFYLREAKNTVSGFSLFFRRLCGRGQPGIFAVFPHLFDKGGADGVIACSYDGLLVPGEHRISQGEGFAGSEDLYLEQPQSSRFPPSRIPPVWRSL